MHDLIGAFSRLDPDYARCIAGHGDEGERAAGAVKFCGGVVMSAGVGYEAGDGALFVIVLKRLDVADFPDQ